MADEPRPAPLPLRRHLNGVVLGGLLATLVVPVGSTIAEYEGQVWPNLLTLGAALVAFLLLVMGLRLGPTADAREVARDGVPARVVVERVVRLPLYLTEHGGDSTSAQMVRLELSVEVEGEPVTRVCLRRWVAADRLNQLRRGAVLDGKVLPGRPQDPALELRR